MSHHATPERGFPEEVGNAYARTRTETIYERFTTIGAPSPGAWRVWSRRTDQTPEEVTATLIELAAEFPKLKVRARTFRVTRVLEEVINASTREV